MSDTDAFNNPHRREGTVTSSDTLLSMAPSMECSAPGERGAQLSGVICSRSAPTQPHMQCQSQKLGVPFQRSPDLDRVSLKPFPLCVVEQKAVCNAKGSPSHRDVSNFSCTDSISGMSVTFPLGPQNPTQESKRATSVAFVVFKHILRDAA